MCATNNEVTMIMLMRVESFNQRLLPLPSTLDACVSYSP